MRFCVFFPKWNFGKVHYFNANLFIYQSFLWGGNGVCINNVLGAVSKALAVAMRVLGI